MRCMLNGLITVNFGWKLLQQCYKQEGFINSSDLIMNSSGPDYLTVKFYVYFSIMVGYAKQKMSSCKRGSKWIHWILFLVKQIEKFQVST